MVYDVAVETTTDAANDPRDHDHNKTIDVGVSGDGSWQWRGYSSLKGTFTTISLDNEKNLGIEVMSRYCKACKSKEGLKISNKTLCGEWFASHKCNLNRVGSAGAMEVVGAKRIFGRSIEKHGLQYTNKAL